MSRLFLFTLIGAAAAAFFHAHQLAAVLPDTVISHFGANGHPNGFMSRELFIGTYAGLTAFMALLFGTMPLLLRVLPTTLINLPNKETWFSEPHRDATLAWLQGWLWAMGTAVLLFLIQTMRAGEQANLDGSRRLGSGFGLSVGVFLVLILAMVAELIVKFTRPPR